MGAAGSTIIGLLRGPYSSNDYELVIRTSKDLEFLLGQEWGAQGKGLHEKLNSVQASRDPLPEELVKNIRFLATIRNRLIHEKDFHYIPDRAYFIANYERSKARLEQILKARGKGKEGLCIVM